MLTCTNTGWNAGTVLMQRGSCEEWKQPCRECEISLETRLRRDECEEGRLEVSQQMLFFKHHTSSCWELAGSTNLEAETVPFNTCVQPNQNKISIFLRKMVHGCVWKLFLSNLHLCSRSKIISIYFISLMPISYNISTTGYSACVNTLTKWTNCRNLQKT